MDNLMKWKSEQRITCLPDLIADGVKEKHQNKILREKVDFSNLYADKPMVDHLFGLPALQLLGGGKPEKGIAGWEKSGLADNDKFQLAMAIFQNHKAQYYQLQERGFVPPEICDVLETSVNFAK